jgi:hypothetical protein
MLGDRGQDVQSKPQNSGCGDFYATEIY